AVSLLDLDA
nr:Chain C, B-ADAPTIN 3 [synthetic construct]1C9I_D Chain D, B-ADAPTIN 3 [synthetic construct]